VIIYGYHSVQNFLKFKKNTIEKIYFSKDSYSELLQKNFIKQSNIIKVSLAEMDKLTLTQDHQGIAAQIKQFPYFDFSPEHASGTICLLDHLEDPRNLGAIIRNALAFNIQNIIIPKDRSCEVTPVTIKASAGTAAQVRISQVTNINNIIRELKNNGYWIYGFDTTGKDKLGEISFDAKTAIVLGSEGTGMRQLTSKLCDFIVFIETSGQIESLNVAAASAVVFYTQYKNKTKVA